MAKKLLGPWSVLYNVNFYSGGDTTSQAFGKHIQEIARIYGLLNALDMGKLGSDEIADAIGSITHNGLNGLQGGTKTERYHLTAAQVQKLDGAAGAGDIIREHNSLGGIQGGGPNDRWHLSKAQVDGLDNLIQNGGGGIVDESLGGDGYVVFANGFTIQWGTTGWILGGDEEIHEYKFPIAFKTACRQVVLSLSVHQGNYGDFVGHVIDFDNTGFRMARNSFPYSASADTRTRWIAVGA